MRPEDITLLAAASSPSLTPDGMTAVFAVSAPDLDDDEAASSLWSVPVDGSAPARRLTRGRGDSAPAVSPDGRWVAFLRRPAPDAEHRSPQLHLVEAAGGEPVALTTHAQHPLGAGAPAWSPDGTRLAYTARVPDPGRHGDPSLPAHRRGPGAEPPRLLVHPRDLLDGVGHTRDQRPHAFVLDVDPAAPAGARPAPRQVTSGDADDEHPAWTADGAGLLVASARHATAEDDLRVGLHRVDVGGAHAGGGAPALVPVVEGDLSVGLVAADPDGRRVWFLAEQLDPTGLDGAARPASLFVAPLDGSAPPQRLTDPDTDLSETPALLVTAAGALVAERTRGAVHLLRVDDGGGARVLLGGPRVVVGAATTPDGQDGQDGQDGSVVVAVVADAGARGDLVRVEPGGQDDDLAGAGGARLTDLGAPLRAAGVRPPHELSGAAPDGYPVHGWVVLPDPAVHGDGPHPVLLSVHGGPFAQYSWALFDEAQVHAGAGYAVVLGNPRGSAGYGEAHGRAVVGAMGGPDADDVVALLDAALADPALGGALDAGRTGVMGGSYGGYMTALLTTRTDRFAAAVVERGYLDATTFVGSADIGWSFPDALHGSAEAMREQSPMTHVARVTTPTLVVHSEEDWRCPVEQGRRWWTALRRQGVDTALLLFPGEGHELSRSGRPSHRVARFRHQLDWWARHLPVTG